MKSEKRKMRLHQRKGYYYCNRVSCPALFLQMRLGKTLITIRNIMKRYNFNLPILVSAPYSALYSWKEELLIEGFTKHDINFLTGERPERFKKLNKPKTFNLINKEGFLSLPEIASVEWGVSILDESTFIKNYDSQVSQFYTTKFEKVERKFILTGTPMPESELDIYQQLLYLDPEILPFNNFYDFRFKLFTQGTRTNRKWIITQEGKQYLTNKLAKYCFIMSRKEAGIGKEKVYEKRMIQLNKSDRKIYDTLAKEFLVEYENQVHKVTDFATTKFIWLRQLCSGYITNEKQISQINDNKNNEVIELSKGELKNSSIIIWCVFTHEIIRLKKLLTHNKISCSTISGKVPQETREERRKYFNKKNIQTLICQPECFKYGANLSTADTSIYYSSPLGLESRLQSEDRMVDIRQEQTDLVIDLITENTIEQDIHNNLKRKGNKQSLLLWIVKRLQRELRV